MSSSPPSLLSRLSLAPALLRAIGSFALSLLALLFRSPENRASTRDRDVAHAFMRALTEYLSVAHLQRLRPPSSTAFEKWRTAHPAEELSTEEIEENAKIHWIGDRKAQKVFLFFHGGGYVLPLSAGHIQLMAQLRAVVGRESGLNVSVAILEYTIAPQAPYPTQLRQASAALSHLLSSGLLPSSIVICGDSAGAHLAFALVSHLLHPHQSVPAVSALPTPLAGLLLISPRPLLSTSSASFARNSDKDILSASTFARWIAAASENSVLATPDGAARDGPYASALDAPPGWWDALPTRVAARVFMSAGSHECLRDDIVDIATVWKEVKGLEVTLVVEHKGVHDSPMLDVDASRPKTDLLRAIESWLAETVRE